MHHSRWLTHAKLQAPDIGAPVGRHSMHPERYREDLARAIHLGFSGSFQERRQLALTMYTEDAEFWHPFATVHGATNISNFFQFCAPLPACV